jgi:hypothetical protein
MVDRQAPVWVTALAAAVPRMPLGRDWIKNQLRRVPVPPFMTRLPNRLGGYLYQCDQRDSVSRNVCYTDHALEPEPCLHYMFVTNIAANEIAWIEAQ